jgi:predicted transcriptional regulator
MKQRKQKIKTTNFSIRIDSDRANKLQALADAEGRSKGDIVKRMIDAAILPATQK